MLMAALLILGAVRPSATAVSATSVRIELRFRRLVGGLWAGLPYPLPPPPPQTHHQRSSPPKPEPE